MPQEIPKWWKQDLGLQDTTVIFMYMRGDLMVIDLKTATDHALKHCM
jgi:hypothetical protein